MVSHECSNVHRCSVWLLGICPDLCLACLGCLACLERSNRINASASCPTPRCACTSPKPLQMCFQMASFDTFRSRSGSSHFRIQRHHPKAMSDLLPDGFIWIPFNPDLDQAMFEPSDTIPKLWQICFSRASCRHLSIDLD